MGIAHILKSIKNPDNVVVVSDEMLMRLQDELFSMMKDIASVCEKYNIRWCLSGGSVLGSIRHNGFIPWDDDIDIFMERSEFERFKSIFYEALGEKYRLRIPGDNGYILNLPQIQKLGTKVKPIQSLEKSDDGLFIDIFILETTFDDVFRRSLHGIVSTWYLFICSAQRMEACKETIFSYSKNDQTVKKEVMKRARFAKLFRVHSLFEWLAISDRYFSHVKKKGKYLVCPSGAKHFFGELYESKLFTDLAKHSFRSEQWYVPNPPEKYLESRFGNTFMAIPDDQEKERHIYLEFDLGD